MFTEICGRLQLARNWSVNEKEPTTLTYNYAVKVVTEKCDCWPFA